MGLPGSGKTYLAEHIVDHLQAANKKVWWLNADRVREAFNDWDFSIDGRVRQSERMRDLAASMSNMDYVICDFVCPLPEMRDNLAADWVVWVDTITKSRYKDTDQIFVRPTTWDFHITTQDALHWGEYVAVNILNNTTTI